MTAQRILGLLLVIVLLVLAALFVRIASVPAPENNAVAKPHVAVTEPAVVIENRKVLVARKTIQAGQFVDKSDLTWGEMDVSGYNWISSDDYSLSQFAGSVAISTISANSLVPYDAVVRPEQQGFLAAVLAPGMRAASIPVNDVTVGAGLIGPGDYVDVLLTFYANSDRGAWSMTQGGDINMLTNKTLATGVRVIAINRRSLADPEQELGRKLTTATVEVSASAAQQLALAAHMGSLSMTLRSQREPGSDAEQMELWVGDIHTASDQLKPKPGLVLMRGQQTQIVGFSQEDENTNEDDNNENGNG
ncbi:Flp pilus assembly protein CpaB [Bacterioplanoides sp.]|uniref:Flp pilus assembly protein CpaB n=1 Tax=Bacterioplanoides sp. TaxID=2066072 RepID=UPI003B00545C